MKYCQNCGAEVQEGAVVCVKCGCSVPQGKPAEDGLSVAAKVFLIIGCIAQGWLLIPLAWCLPITISIFGRLRRGEPVGTGLKVCSLLFVNMIAGILLLCRSDNR